MDGGEFIETGNQCLVLFDDKFECLCSLGDNGIVSEFIALISRKDLEGYPGEIGDKYLQFIQKALTGEDSGLCHEWNDEHGALRYFRATFRSFEKNRKVLCCIEDITRICDLEKQKNHYENELLNYKKSLDQHAIVAITDRRGVILSVNEKFCEISKYPMNELIGKTHKIINSKHHPKEFFREMWECIGRGEVWHGDICNRDKTGGLYWVDTTIVPLVNDHGVIDRYLAIRADITKRINAEREATNLAFFDELTGLANRRSFKARLDRLLEHGAGGATQHAMIMLDMDNFKDVNDAFGHDMGDEFLKQVANRINGFNSDSIQTFRLGGDEFVLLISPCDECEDGNSSAVRRIAENIREALNVPFIVSGKMIMTTPSIGISVFDNKLTSEEIMKSADIAMYHSKNTGKNKISFFKAQLQDKVDKRTRLLSMLHHAISHDELELLYQPIYSSNRTVVGAEALLRWNSPQFGVVSPMDFIPIAEESDLILDIGRWIIENACDRLAEWKKNPVCSEWILSVNISARQLQKKDFSNDLLGILVNSGHHDVADRLQLEITESMLLDNIPRTISAMTKLRSSGIRFSIDDFGTGFSSLSYLTRLPLDTLKIDRSFVSQMIASESDMVVVKAIISLAKSLNLKVIAEGVETADQMDQLKGLGCDHFQGFLFSRPVSAESLCRLS